MSDVEVAAALTAPTRTKIRTRFISWRTIATVLSAEEYAAVKQAAQALASADARVSDMLEMLKLPCDGQGTTGGIDDSVKGDFVTLLGLYGLVDLFQYSRAT